MNVVKMTDGDKGKLVDVWVRFGQASSDAFEYFNNLHGRFNEEGKNWKEHIDSVLFAGKDDKYNALHRAEDTLRQEVESVTANMVVIYPYLKDLTPRMSWMTSEEVVSEKIDGVWRDAVLDSLREDFASETSVYAKELSAFPKETSLSQVSVDDALWFWKGMSNELFRVVRKTALGRIVFLENMVTSEVNRCTTSSARVSFCVVPKDRVEAIQDLSKRWRNALEANGVIK